MGQPSQVSQRIERACDCSSQRHFITPSSNMVKRHAPTQAVKNICRGALLHSQHSVVKLLMALITYPLKSPVQRAHQIRSLARDTPLMLFLCKSKTASPVKSRTASSVPVIAHYTTSTRVGVAELFRPTVKQSHCNNDRSHMRGATYH